MGRIAQELKVGTMSLYYYVKTKDDLIAVMDDALMGEALLIPSKRLAARDVRDRPADPRGVHPSSLGPGRDVVGSAWDQCDAPCGAVSGSAG